MTTQLRQPSPPGGIHPHHGPPGQVNVMQRINPAHVASLNEVVWLQIGGLTELMGDMDGAINAYEQALRHNQFSIQAMNAISCILRTKENFPRAVEYLQAILKLDGSNGEVWGSLGHCYLMMEDLQQAYGAYQQALYHLRDPKEPKLWYGIGILYDRYGSLEHAEEAFSQVMRMEPNFEKANEIYFRLGIIYKQQSRFGQSLDCFRYIVHDPPRPLTEEDIWFQIGHVHEQQKDYDAAKRAYRRVLDRDPNHAKVLQQLGWLHHQQSNDYQSQEHAIEYLELSVKSDQNDSQSWYLLGRCYMSQQKFSKAYEAYQQAVYRDGRNPTFWCSIGVLYYQINQYRDALDAYSRAIRLNPYISEVWYDLGTLYESCNNQTTDALDAYQRAADLDPGNRHIKDRLALLRSGQASGLGHPQAIPAPQDVQPQHFQQGPGVGGPTLGPQWGMQAQAPGPPPSGPGPIHPAHVGEWSRRLASVDHAPGQPPNPYTDRDMIRQPPPRQPSPRSDQMRQHQEPHRHTPIRRGSPPPIMNHMPPAPYPGPSGMSHSNPLQAPSALPARIPNPNYANPAGGMPQANGNYVVPPQGRGGSPPPEIRPIAEDPRSSPGSAYPHHPHHLGPQHPRDIAAGAPPPTAAIAAAEAAAARDRDDRPPPGGPVGFKRAMDEDEYKMPNKKPSNGDSRGRLEDHHYRRVSPPERQQSPRDQRRRRSSSEARREEARREDARREDARREDQRRADQNYHPSEAAHHAPALPSLRSQSEHLPLPPPPPAPSEPAREERRDPYEPAARKVEVDEDYDDDGEADEKRMMGSGGRNSPNGPGRSIMNGQPKIEAQG